MPTGQTQKVYENEKALEPELIRDVHEMLGDSNLRAQIRNYKILSGIMFFEVRHTQFSRRLGRMTYVRHFLVAGEDPGDKGCIVAMHLSINAQRLETLHMKSLWDTRGGIANVAWCSAFHFQRKIFRSGTNSRSYWALRSARRDYCKELLKLLDVSRAFENQNWQAVQNVIDGRRNLFQPCECEQCRMRRLVAGADDSDGHDDDPDSGFDQSRPSDAEPDEHRPIDHYHHPGPDSDNNEDDPDDDDENDWRKVLNQLRRQNSPNGGAENETNLLDDGQDPMDMEDNPNEDVDMDLDTIDAGEDWFNYHDDRSNSSNSIFMPFARETSTQDFAHPKTDNDEMPNSPVQPKLEPKVEPEAEAMTFCGYTESRHIPVLIDLTADDDSMGSGNNTMEVIELTEDSDTLTNATSNNRRCATIDLTQDSEDFQSPTMEVIELDD